MRVIKASSRPPKYSRHLREYLGRIQEQTGREVVIREDHHRLTADSPGSFLPHPEYLLVLVRAGWRGDGPELERLIAHEATHGLLIYGRGYSSLKLTGHDSGGLVRLVVTMVDDIVVNRLIQEGGFPPFHSSYLETVRRASEATRQGKGICTRFSDPRMRDRYMVFSYILAWGFSAYCELAPEELRVIGEFLQLFAESYPEQYQIASQVRAALEENDVFHPAGHRAATERLLDLWGLRHLVELKRP